jgi:hypothetical protein
MMMTTTITDADGTAGAAMTMTTISRAVCRRSCGVGQRCVDWKQSEGNGAMRLRKMPAGLAGCFFFVVVCLAIWSPAASAAPLLQIAF